jgi:catechol 2,3-dioxygenase-like lactoylglutathione lyase family enzyme
VSRLNRIAPVFGVRDLAASLAYYGRLGFETREYEGGGYGFATRGGVELHLGLVPEDDPHAVRSTAYIWVDDADEVAQAWRSVGADVRMPQDTDWGQHEGVVIDPDGNIIRFGSPRRRPPAEG